MWSSSSVEYKKAKKKITCFCEVVFFYKYFNEGICKRLTNLIFNFFLAAIARIIERPVRISEDMRKNHAKMLEKEK